MAKRNSIDLKEIFSIDSYLCTGIVDPGTLVRDLQHKDRIRIVKKYQLVKDNKNRRYTGNVDQLWETFFRDHPRVKEKGITSYGELLYYATERRQFNIYYPCEGGRIIS